MNITCQKQLIAFVSCKGPFTAHNSVPDHDISLSYRNIHIDILRSLALLTIFINHIPRIFYEHITHKNFDFSDSTEIFVLLSDIFSILT
ncbi:OpgC domain-containing protein [Bartonella australis]|uniref:OpgC domain-containing protein n=1 Tax=Bartonella australis TaxID=388640 RepID=UPI000A03A33D